MKKSLVLKAAAVLTMLALALVVVGVPRSALAAITGVTITPGSGQSYDIPVDGTVTLTAAYEGTPDGSVSYSWGISAANVKLDTNTGDTVVVTGLLPGTSTTVTVTATDSVGPTSVTNSVVINVKAMTISETTLSMNGGATHTLTIGNVASGTTTTWAPATSTVAQVNSSGLVSAIGGGTAVITVTNTPTTTGAAIQTKQCTVTVSPIITITPTTQNITLASTPGTVQLKVDYGGELITSSSTVSWQNSNTTAGTLTSAPTTFTPSGSSLLCTATYLSNSSGTNGTSLITATISGAGSYSVAKTATINVRTARYLTLEGDTSLNSSDRYGDYTLTLHEANGDIVNDDTSTAHWSWSSSYLALSSATLNSSRADMEDGQAHIQLYARYNTPTSGTRLYAWINDDSNNRVYTTIYITGLSSLPQTGQDMTLVYIFGGLGATLLVGAGVWYGIRKKRIEA